MKPHIRSATLAAALAGMGFAGAVSADTITFVSWGGAYTKSQVKACVEPYEAQTGTKFNVVDYNGGLAEVRTQVEAGNVQWDIVCATQALDVCGNPNCPGEGGCLEANDTPGCDDEECCELVCEGIAETP